MPEPFIITPHIRWMTRSLTISSKEPDGSVTSHEVTVRGQPVTIDRWLQQAWRDADGNVEWRDIPVVSADA